MPDDDYRELAPEFTVIIDGTEVPPDAREAIDRIRVEESVNASGMFAIQLHNLELDSRRPKWSDADLFRVGASVEIRLGYVGALQTVISGEITGLEPAFTQASSLVTVRGYDRLHRFRRRRHTRSFLQMKDSQIAEQIAGELGLASRVEDSREVHPYLFQNNQTDIDFLLARAGAIGYELLMEGQTLVFRPRKHERGKALSLEWGIELVSFFPVLTTVPQVDGVVVRGWDRSAKQALVASATVADIPARMQGSHLGPATAQGAFGQAQAVVMDHPISSPLEADQLAKGLLNEIALSYVTGEGKAVGNPTIRAGSVIELKELGRRFSGLYYVTDAVHTSDEQGYLTTFVVRRNAS